MRRAVSSFFIISTALTLLVKQTVSADVAEQSGNGSSPEQAKAAPEAPAKTKASFAAFTGKITRNKVRLRLQPTLEGPILRELNSGDLIVITGETEEFYAVEPPADVKGYIFRTFVLDGVVEGNHVNVRLEPDLNAPVIAQMNSGDRVMDGSIYSKDKKWIEFTPPSSTRFYVAKELVKRVGDRSYMATLQRRHNEVVGLLSSASQSIPNELQKSFEQINIDEINRKLNTVINQYGDFKEESARAKEMLASLQDAYLKKKIAYMENRLQNQPPPQQIQMMQPMDVKISEVSLPANALTAKMTAWQSVESRIYEAWASQGHPNASMDDFYNQQGREGVVLQGIVEPYDRIFRNKPGDYLLVNQSNHMPIAYIYSTRMNLQPLLGQVVSLRVSPRDNHNFAFPAYFVLGIE
jgi:hypothetical protein